jgi:hypothetical protein
VHGVEGFTGSAIQLQILASHQQVAGEQAVILVHAVNPYGMAWLRRVNENNVDLNRNFLGPNERYEGVADAYRRLNRLLNPESPPRRIDPFLPIALWYILRYGFQNLKQAVAEGQYEFPKGLFFGGHQLEQSAALMLDWCKEKLSNAQRIVCVDVHTGLGKYAEDVLFVSVDSESRQFQKYRAWLGDRVTPLYESAVAYRLKGGFVEALERAVTGPEWSCIGQEFGTRKPLNVLRALREENRWHHYGDRRRLDHPAKQQLLETFCPSDPTWRQRVLERGVELFDTVMSSFSQAD